MGLGIGLVVLSLVGIVYGCLSKKKGILFLSIILLLATLLVWYYFYLNPY